MGACPPATDGVAPSCRKRDFPVHFGENQGRKNPSAPSEIEVTLAHTGNSFVYGLCLRAATGLAAVLLPGCASPSRDAIPLRPPGFFFTDVADQVGLGGIQAKRVLWVDLDGDGFADCVLDNRLVFLNRSATGQAGRVFLDYTLQSRINDGPGHDQARHADCLQAADLDNDGDIDLFSGRYCDFERPVVTDGVVVLNDHGLPVKAVPDHGQRSEIFLNDGAGRFTVLDGALRPNPPATTTTAMFFDADRDGRVDLFVGNWYREYGQSFACYPSLIYRGLGDGTFRDVTKSTGWSTVPEPGLENSHRPVYGLSHCDFNNDGEQDVFVAAYGRQWNLLLGNQGDFRFGDVAELAGFDGDAIRHGRYTDQIRQRDGRQDEPPFRANGNTFDVACADYDNDGDMDLFVAEIAHAWAGDSADRSCLLVNLGAEAGFRFERRDDLGIDRHHEGKRWNEGDLYAAWIDFDNDGLQDLLISSGDYPDGQFLRLFQQQPDHRFIEVTVEAGFAWEGSGCLSLADFDHDGDVDILVTRSNMRLGPSRRSALPERVALFRNNVGQRNHFLTVRLIGRGAGGANRSAIGARVIVRTGNLVQTREVYGGLGHNSHRNEFPLTFGLGHHERVDSIEVRWPNRNHTVTRLRNLRSDQFITITEGVSAFGHY